VTASTAELSSRLDALKAPTHGVSVGDDDEFARRLAALCEESPPPITNGAPLQQGVAVNGGMTTTARAPSKTAAIGNRSLLNLTNDDDDIDALMNEAHDELSLDQRRYHASPDISMERIAALSMNAPLPLPVAPAPSGTPAVAAFSSTMAPTVAIQRPPPQQRSQPQTLPQQSSTRQPQQQKKGGEVDEAAQLMAEMAALMSEAKAVLPANANKKDNEINNNNQRQHRRKADDSDDSDNDNDDEEEGDDDDGDAASIIAEALDQVRMEAMAPVVTSPPTAAVPAKNAPGKAVAKKK
jgi:hypothetical protein